jgi:hypothetical protein
VREDRRRHHLFVLQLAALARQPSETLGVVTRYEQAWLQEGRRASIPREHASADRVAELMARLIAEENRLAVGAKLAWIEYARQELRALERSGLASDRHDPLASDERPGLPSNKRPDR